MSGWTVKKNFGGTMDSGCVCVFVFICLCGKQIVEYRKLWMVEGCLIYSYFWTFDMTDTIWNVCTICDRRNIRPCRFIL